jgi:hypothetical protein
VPGHALGNPFLAQDCVWRPGVVVAELRAAAIANVIRRSADIIESRLTETVATANGTTIIRSIVGWRQTVPLLICVTRFLQGV